MSAPRELSADEAVQALAAGAVVVVPTDTVYGVGVCPAVPGAVERLRDVKQRPASVHVAVLVADAGQAAAVVALDERAVRLAARFWPGPLTLVLPAAAGVDLGVSEPGAGIGVRCPAHDGLRALLGRTGPLAVTSANLHGEPTATTAAEAAALLGVDYLDGGVIVGEASTVVDARGGPLRVLRDGPIALEALERAAGG